MSVGKTILQIGLCFQSVALTRGEAEWQVAHER
jgi:hypothetical protein